MELPCTCHVAQRTCALNRSIWRGNMNDEGKAAASAGGAVGLSALASFIGLCCIGPWSVALFGVSGAIALARWQTYRPHILIVAGLLLAWAFWRVYRSPARSEEHTSELQSLMRHSYAVFCLQKK